MAHRRKRKKSSSPMRRVYGRRSSAGVGAIDTQNVLGAALGAVAAKLLDKVIPDTLDKKIVAGGKIVLGAFLPMFVKSGKAKVMLAGAGAGFVAVGTMDLLTEFGVLQGLGAADDTELAVALEGIEDVQFEEVSSRSNTMNENVLGEEVLGADDLNVVNGNEDLSVVNGFNDDDDDDEPMG